MAINYNTDLGDTLDLGRDYVSVLKDGLNVSPDPTQVKPADVLQYPLDVEVDHQDMLLIRIFKQVDNPLSLTGDSGLVKFQEENGEITGIKNVNALVKKDERLNKNLSDREANSLKKDSKYIWLPIPQQISDSLTVGYSEDTLNPLQAAGLALADRGIADPVGALKDTAQIASSVFGKGTNIGSGTMNAIKSILSATAINQLGANVNPQSLITRSSVRFFNLIWSYSLTA